MLIKLTIQRKRLFALTQNIVFKSFLPLRDDILLTSFVKLSLKKICQTLIFHRNFLNMPSLIVIGSQWGDEGKGKLIDILASQADFVVRYQGGANAGHTLKVKQKKVVVHSIPSSVFHSHVTGLISSGAVLDPEALCGEIQTLKEQGLPIGEKQLLISDSATLLLDHHKQLDQSREQSDSGNKIGTTGKGIGPAYESRASRKAILFRDLFQNDKLLFNKLKEQVKECHTLLKNLYQKEPLPVERTFEKIKTYREILKKHRCQNMSLFLSGALKEKKKILFEGAQGALLDLYHGTYPYVTSSSTLAGGVLSSCGLGFFEPIKTLAVAKAYSTRVGEGPFFTECINTPEGQHLQEKGEEFGATTGRKRRCGWLDLPALKYAVRLNSSTSLALMKLDVLRGLDEIKVCVAYQINSQTIEDFPVHIKDCRQVKPIYKVFKGWQKDISLISSKKDLPAAALDYLNFISQAIGIPIDIISVGPSRSQTLYNSNKFFDEFS